MVLLFLELPVYLLFLEYIALFDAVYPCHEVYTFEEMI